MRGPGKYDDLCTLVREKSNAAMAITIIQNGDEGSGFSVQIDKTRIKDEKILIKLIPDMLVTVASEIRKDFSNESE